MDRKSLGYYLYSNSQIDIYKNLSKIATGLTNSKKHESAVMNSVLIYDKAKSVLESFLLAKYNYDDIISNKYLKPWLDLYVDSLEIFSICCFYISNPKFKLLGETASNKILFYSNNVALLNRTFSNMKYYVKKIDILSRHELKIDSHKIFNPSIVKISNESTNCYFIIVREQVHVNNIYLNKNYGFVTDENFKFVEVVELLDTDKRKKIKGSFSGVEDIRITLGQTFKNTENIQNIIKGLYCCATSPDSKIIKSSSGSYPCPEMNLIKYGEVEAHPNASDSIIKYHVKPTNFYTLSCWDSLKPQKNWLSYVRNNKIELFYSTNPTIVLSTDISIQSNSKSESKSYGIIDCSIKSTKKYSWKGEFLYNSAGPIRLIKPKVKYPEEYNEILNSKNWLFVIHEKFEVGSGHFFYYHRFLLTDDNFQILIISPCFVFEKVDIEYCSSITCDNKNENYLIGQSSRDTNAFINKVDPLVPVEWLNKGKTLSNF